MRGGSTLVAMVATVMVLAATLTAGSRPVLAQIAVQSGVISDIEVDGDRLTAKVSFASSVALDIELEFEEAIGLSVSSLGLSAELIHPLDGNLLARLPMNQPITIPASFPVLLQIEPPSSGPLAFTGVYQLEIHTHDLSYQGSSPLRLFKAPLGGDFEDVTSLIAPGSYRARGTDGGFSQFLIASDLRSVDDVIVEKLDRLRNQLGEHYELIPSTVYEALSILVDDAEWHFSSGDLLSAMASLDGFGREVEAHSGDGEIPNAWRSSRDLENVAGQLRGTALSARFSLSQKANQGP